MEYQSTKSIYNNVTKDEFVSTSEISDEEAEPKALAIDFVKDTLTRKGIRLLQEIGSGAYGRVWKIVNEEGRVFAAKIPHRMRKASLKEMSVVCSCSHPHIVKMKEYIPEIETLIMEFEEGGNLSDFLKKQTQFIGWSLYFKFASQICQAMQYLHLKKGIFHRDLRCTNILVTKDMNVKITDFGISLNKNVNVKPDFLHTLYVNDKEWYEEIQEDNLLNQKKAMFTQFLDVRQNSTLKMNRMFSIVLYTMLLYGSEVGRITSVTDAVYTPNRVPSVLKEILETCRNPQTKMNFIGIELLLEIAKRRLCSAELKEERDKRRALKLAAQKAARDEVVNAYVHDDESIESTLLRMINDTVDNNFSDLAFQPLEDDSNKMVLRRVALKILNDLENTEDFIHFARQISSLISLRLTESFVVERLSQLLFRLDRDDDNFDDVLRALAEMKVRISSKVAARIKQHLIESKGDSPGRRIAAVLMKSCKEGNELELLLQVLKEDKPDAEPFVILVLNVFYKIVTAESPQNLDDIRNKLYEFYTTTTNQTIAANTAALLLLLKHPFENVDDIIHFLVCHFYWRKSNDHAIWDAHVDNLVRLAIIEHGSVSALSRGWIKMKEGIPPEAIEQLQRTKQKLKEQEAQQKLQNELQHLFFLLQSPNWRLRKRAALQLKSEPFISRPDVRERLMHIGLFDAKEEVRMAAAIALLCSGEKDSALVELIPGMLTNSDQNIRIQALELVQSLDLVKGWICPFSVLVDLARSDPAICIREIALIVMRKCMTEEDYPLVIECAEHMLENDKEDGIIRIKALVCVLSIPKEHQPGFINKYIYKLLSDGTDQEKIWVCRQVIYAFERSLDEQTTNKLCELLHAESRFVRQAAALALKHTPKAETISNLLDVLQNDHDDFVRDTVATTLNSIAHS